MKKELWKRKFGGIMKNGKLAITLLVVLVSIVVSYVWLQADVKANSVEAVRLDSKGCKPAQKHKGQLGIMEYRLNSIDKKQADFAVEQKEMRKENDAAFKEILKRLPE